jgi:hypothetical protein
VISPQRHVDWSVRCETPAGLACQPPENTSRKACDEEARLVEFSYRRRSTNSSLNTSLYPSSSKKLTLPLAESEHPETEINYFQKTTINTKTAFFLLIRSQTLCTWIHVWILKRFDFLQRFYLNKRQANVIVFCFIDSTRYGEPSIRLKL